MQIPSNQLTEPSIEEHLISWLMPIIDKLYAIKADNKINRDHSPVCTYTKTGQIFLEDVDGPYGAAIHSYEIKLISDQYRLNKMILKAIKKALFVAPDKHFVTIKQEKEEINFETMRFIHLLIIDIAEFDNQLC